MSDKIAKIVISSTPLAKAIITTKLKQLGFDVKDIHSVSLADVMFLIQIRYDVHFMFSLSKNENEPHNICIYDDDLKCSILDRDFYNFNDVILNSFVFRTLLWVEAKQKKKNITKENVFKEKAIKKLKEYLNNK